MDKKEKIALEAPEHFFGNGTEGYAASAMHEGIKKRDGSEEKNEDATLADAEHDLFGVFDGVGGEKGGDIASRTAKETVAEIVMKFPKNLTEEQTREALDSALAEAHKKILRFAEKNPDFEGLGTTASVVKIWEKDGMRRAVIGHIGDSRIYVLHNDGTLEQVTEDDSHADTKMIKSAHEKLVDQGLKHSELEAEEKHAFQYRNIISRALGTGNGEPHFYSADIKEGDLVLITSDGIHDNLTDKEIREVLAEAGISNGIKVEKLIYAARERSRMDKKIQPAAKPDDMSAILVEIQRKIQGKESSKELPIGTQVNVKRSSGAIESDWKIQNIFEKDGKKFAMVTKEREDGRWFEKDIPYEELEKLNS